MKITIWSEYLRYCMTYLKIQNTVMSKCVDYIKKGYLLYFTLLYFTFLTLNAEKDLNTFNELYLYCSTWFIMMQVSGWKSRLRVISVQTPCRES